MKLRRLMERYRAIKQKAPILSELPVFLLSHSPEQMTYIITSCKT
jgi:hypothetical protein